MEEGRTSAHSEDVVVVQTESGEQIALPMSALPSDFVPGDSGQIIMVEGSIDEQEQEVVVESSNIPEVKSYAPTCGTTCIYQPTQITTSTITLEPATPTITNDCPSPEDIKPEVVIEPVVPRTKQKRKESIILRPIQDDIEFIVVEPLEPVQQPKRREYRTKKKIALEKLSKPKIQPQPQHQSQPQPQPQLESQSQPQLQPHSQPQLQPQQQQQQQPHPLPQPQSQQQSQSPLQTQTERRTRISNSCRVATGKSYKCKDCEFSTDRINNIIIHIREACPKIQNKK